MTGWTDVAETSLSVLFPDTAATFTAEETARLQARLFLLLERQIRLKTQGDSTSLLVEDATELFASLCFTLQAYLDTKALDAHLLLAGDPAALLRAAQEALAVTVTKTRQLYDLALAHVQPFGHRALMDTLAGIGEFFRGYDVRLYAHQIPAHIDYQLCHPVPETRVGVFYVYDYLRALLIENDLLARLPTPKVLRLLGRLSADFRELLINLYEPIAANITGLALLQLPEERLAITMDEADRLSDLLLALPPREARACLRNAAQMAAGHLHLPAGDVSTYLTQTAEELYPRLSVGFHSARGVFLALPSDASSSL